MRIPILLTAILMLGVPAPASTQTDGRGAPLLIAHRGASAYAPEHTAAAYELGIEQGADFIEPDLQVTRDGVLVAIHDLTLERTTDVREVFPDRFREDEDGVRRWYVGDFTLAEIQTLDAGSWFDPAFRGERVPTFAEVIELARGRAGIIPETKAPEVYAELGHDMARLLVEELEAHGLHVAGADPETPVVVQSFSPASLRTLREDLESDLPLVLLLSGRNGAQALGAEGLDAIARFASGIGPNKALLLQDPEAVERAHVRGLLVTPWTFRARDPGRFGDVTEEMAHFLCDLGVDGLFTDNPDRFPRRGDTLDCPPG
jgi:glycerophosphoryl diester phosphodiesterase